MRFIRMTDAQGGEPTYLAVEHITCVESNASRLNTPGDTTVHLAGGHLVRLVESIDFVMAALGFNAGDDSLDDPV